jgi:arylsulfatase A-like enzyme
VAITMDWFPTLLEAAGTTPDTGYPPDGISLLPVLMGQHDPLPRTLFWRYKTNAQRAVRDGDFKYLKIRDNTFLFDVVADPRERANLKDRHHARAERMVADWNDWNATMLPEIPDSFGETYTAAQLADHMGLS